MVEVGDNAGVNNADRTPPEVPEARFRRLLEHSPDPMCVHAGGLVVYVNPAAVRGIGAQDADQLVGHMITDFVHPDSIPALLARIAALRAEGDSSPPSEAMMLRLDGSPLPVEAVSVLTQWEGQAAYQVIFRDLTLQKAAEATLRHQAALVSAVSDAIIATSMTGLVTSWNPAAETIYRRRAAHALARPLGEVLGADIDPAAIVAGGGVAYSTHYTADGSGLAVRVAAAVMDDGFVLLCSDHTALRRAERRFQTVVNVLEEGVTVFDSSGRVDSINPAGLRILGLPEEDVEQVKGLSIAAMRPVPGSFDADGNRLDPDQWPGIHTLLTGEPVRHQVVGFERSDGTRRWLSVSCCRLDPAEGEQSSVAVSFSDITDRHNAEKQLAYKANHDALTGLPNRAHAEARVAQELQPHASQQLAAVMFIDLDKMKTVNDTFGHRAGDAVIKAAGQRLRTALRADDFLARLGGDEFIGLVFGQMDRGKLDRLAQRVHAELARSFHVDGAAHPITASIGIVEVTRGDRRGASEILDAADAAMYTAKADKKGTHYAEAVRWPPTAGGFDPN